MRLLLSDKELNINFLESDENKYIDLSKLRISNCIGCLAVGLKLLESVLSVMMQ